MNNKTLLHEPHKTKTVRRLLFPTLEERKRNLAEVDFNVFHLTPRQINFDMCSLGTSAVSQEQLAGQLVGDEAYAGARNFETLQEAAGRVLGHAYLCPTHNLLGCLKLLAATLAPSGCRVAGNARTPVDFLAPRGIQTPDVRDRRESIFTGNVDLPALQSLAGEGGVALVFVQAFADGQHPFSLANLLGVRGLADRLGVRLVLDASRVIENAWYIQKHERGQSGYSIADLVRRVCKASHVLAMDGAQDPKGTCGGFLSTDNPNDFEKFINQVIVYEGLHTYGGMSGRSMEVLARGLAEMCDEAEVHWVMQQTERFTARLRDAGVPLERGCDGAYIKADEFFPHIRRYPEDAFSAALYLTSGVRAVALGAVGRDHLAPVQIPRLAATNQHLDAVADAIAALFAQRDRVAPLEVVQEGRWRDQMRYRWVFGELEEYSFDTYPYLIHTFERVGSLDREQRGRAMREAGYNTFLLRSADVTIDLLTDSGTSAMSTAQWAYYDAARPAAAASDAYRRLEEALREALGYRHVIPTHQGRAAEHILSEIMITPGQVVPGNMYFTTTKLHQELAGGVFADVIVDQAHEPADEYPWKGDIDMAKLRAVVEANGPERVAYVSFEHSVNMAGGQPVSMDNMKEVYAYCSSLKIPVFFDATRAVENAYMIQQRDPRYRNTKIRDILREMMLYGDGCTISGKKDYLINIGGVLAFRDNAEWAERARGLLRIYEGAVTDGGLAAADLAAMARGAEEMLDDRYVRSRVRQTEFLGELLEEGGVPIVKPPGSHAIFIDARRFLDHLDQEVYPAQRLAAEIYVQTGVRSMERGVVSKGRDPDTGENLRPKLELVRLTIPRRVYTDDHMRAVAEGIIGLYRRRGELKGLRFVYEPPVLRFFQGRFEELRDGSASG